MQRLSRKNAALSMIAAGALLLTAGVAAAQPEPPATRTGPTNLRACIDATSATWTPYDDHTILVRSNGRAFLVTTNRCPRLADPLPRLITRLMGGSQICSPRDVRLSVADSADTIPVPCFIQSIAPMTEEQARALERQRR
jgi:hypothetical protein